ncbi:hypothetical protein [Primorskyibacter sp. S187A]|uniref:hypothetical protein n=1 Tax=Primorskyibacter sp. S187A TaxID=3415130 RepID=UPI003C7B310E
MTEFDAKGYARFPAEPATRAWADAALSAVKPCLTHPDHAAQWVCGQTWFVGVDVLPNDAKGTVSGVPLTGKALDAAQALMGPQDLHAAQVSVTRAGYPKPRVGESEAAYGFRMRRDAAHVDGLLPIGEARRRKLREPHAWILGIALNAADHDASPLVVWDGSHIPLGRALSAALRDVPATQWADFDLTEIYTRTRRDVFETCPRKTLPLKTGEAVLLHRHLLHGVAPWGENAQSDALGRAIAYFRPQLLSNWESWQI